jgi:hypothetical protein
MVSEIYGPLSEVVPIDPDDFLDASAVRHAATSLFLPRIQADVPLNLHVLTAA